MEKEIHEHQKSLQVLKLVLAGFLLLIIILVVFTVGVYVGQERAQYSFLWAENYHKNFGGPKKGIFGNFPEMDFMNGHGIFGEIIKIDVNTLVVRGEDTIERTVVASDKTSITNNTGATTFSTLKIGDMIVIIGSPNSQGQIDAKFIRVLPDSSVFRHLFSVEI